MTLPPSLAELAGIRSAARDARRASRAHAVYAASLSALGSKAEACTILRDALALGYGNAEDYEALGFVAFGLNEHAMARACYAEVVRLAPSDALAHYNLASSERNVGSLAAASDSCDAALRLDPQLHQAALLRSQMATQTEGANHIDALRASLAQHSGSIPARIFLNYALGKELEDLAAYDEAFDHFSRGATARRRTLDYAVHRDVEILGKIRRAFGGPVGREPSGEPDRFGFIIGLPRSGTTLIERVLTGNNSVRTNGETDNVSTAILERLPRVHDNVFDNAAIANFRSIGDRYRQLAGPVAAGHLVLEKLPLNYLYAGIINRSMPDAPIIFVDRDPFDNCLGMFTTLFGSAYPFSYDLNELADYYVAYRQLAGHWGQTLNGRMVKVSYERFVNEPGVEGARIAAEAGVRWQPDMLKVEANRSPTATASAVQVRSPIHRGAIGRWRRYERHLEPLLDRLSAHGISPHD